MPRHVFIGFSIVLSLIAYGSLAGTFAHCEPKSALRGTLAIDLVDNPFRANGKTASSAGDATLVINQGGKITIEALREVGGNEVTAYYESMKASKESKESRARPRLRLEVSEDFGGTEISSIELAEPLAGMAKGKVELECEAYDVTESAGM